MDLLPRQPARRACLAWSEPRVFWVCAAVFGAGSALADETIKEAELTAPTDRYAHAVLGDAIEYGALKLTATSGKTRTHELPISSVFEDITARLVDVTGDGANDVIVVESHELKGARLVVYGWQGIIAATPYIGTRFRWLAPIGAADMNGDGKVEIAYIDRPHLAKTLRVWQFNAGALTEIATLRGLTNHKIGEDFITGGLRECNERTEMITVDARWQNVMTTYFDGANLISRVERPFDGQGSVQAALNCR